MKGGAVAPKEVLKQKEKSENSNQHNPEGVIR